jgi:GNAT superfamily N-acetyltransferase
VAETAKTVRSATTDDGAAIALVHVRSWQEAYRGQLPAELLDSLSIEQRTRWWAEGWWSQNLARRRLLVAEEANDVRGFAAIGPSRDDDATAPTGEVYAIYVDPGAWGQGLGRRLMKRALYELRAANFAEATLWVLESNRRARRFYEIGGWQDDGRRRIERLREGVLEVGEVRLRRDLLTSKWPPGG